MDSHFVCGFKIFLRGLTLLAQFQITSSYEINLLEYFVSSLNQQSICDTFQYMQKTIEDLGSLVNILLPASMLHFQISLEFWKAPWVIWLRSCSRSDLCDDTVTVLNQSCWLWISSQQLHTERFSAECRRIRHHRVGCSSRKSYTCRLNREDSALTADPHGALLDHRA